VISVSEEEKRKRNMLKEDKDNKFNHKGLQYEAF
jgi:hypothetical protein